MKVKYNSIKPIMTDYVRSIIKELASSQKLPAKLVQRAKVIDLLDQGERIIDIADKVHLHRNKITKWRQRFNKSLPEINELATNKEI